MRFLLGNFGSGKTTTIKNEVAKLFSEKQDVLVIVPSRQHKDAFLKDLLQNQQGIIGNPVITLRDLQNKLIEHIFPIPSQRPQSLTNFSTFLIISSICTQYESQFKVFKNMSSRPELIKMIYRLINSLRDKDINSLSSSPELKDKIDDIQFILSHYHKYLEEKNISDSKYQIDLICQYISKVDSSIFPSNIYIDGFLDYTASQFKFIQNVSQHFHSQNKNVTISICDIPHPISQQSIENFIEAFPLAEKIQLTTNMESVKLADSFLQEQEFINKELDIYEIQAFGKSKEVEYIVNQIKKLCITEDYKLEDILVISNKQDFYSSTLSSALKKAQIPFSFGKDDKLSQNPLIIFIKRLLKLMSHNLTHESLEFLAQSNYIKPEYQELWIKTSTILPFAIDGKTQAWEKAFIDQLNYLDKQDDSETLINELNTLKQSILQLCKKLYSIETHAKLPIQDIIQLIVNLIEFLGIQESLANSTSIIKHKKIIEQSIAKDYSALLKLKEILLELQKSLESIGHQTISLNNFLFFFNIIIEETRYRSEIPQKDLLRILTPNDTRGIFAKAVFVLGLNEGDFPSTPKLELFDYFERSQLNSISKKILGVSLWTTEIDYFSEQKLLFATAISRARDKLFFSRTPVNEKGVYFNISHFLQRIIDKQINYTKIPKTDSKKADNTAIFFKKHDADEYFEQSHLVFLQKEHNDNASQAYTYIQNINKANDLFEKDTTPSEELTKYFGYIGSLTEITKRYAESNIAMSPTRIEKIGRCRYQGLWQGYWKLQSYKLPSYKPEAADYGTLYHDTLEHYLRKNPQGEFDAELLKQTLQERIAHSQQSYLFNLDYHYIYLILRNFLMNVEPQLKLQQEVKYLELSSGDNEIPNQNIPINQEQSLTVYSRIDRVDRNTIDNSYSVIDYKKSGAASYKGYQKTPFNLFQGFLYSELLRVNNKTPIQDISYIFLEKPDTFQEYPGTVSKSKLYQSLGEFQDFKYKEITRLLNLLAQGNFSPYTSDTDIGEDVSRNFTEKFGEKFERENPLKCAYCELHKICLRRQKKLRAF